MSFEEKFEEKPRTKSVLSRASPGVLCFALGACVVLLAQNGIRKHAALSGAPGSARAVAQQTAASGAGPASDPLLGDDPYAQGDSAAKGGSNARNGLVMKYGNDPFFGGQNPFRQMLAMQQHLEAQMEQQMAGQLGGMPGAGAASVQDQLQASIQKREDKKFVYYDIALKNLGKENLKVSIANGQIDVSGQIERKSRNNGDNGGGTYFNSSFQRAFPVPPDVDSDKVQMERTQDLLTLKFPKLDPQG